MVLIPCKSVYSRTGKQSLHSLKKDIHLLLIAVLPVISFRCSTLTVIKKADGYCTCCAENWVMKYSGWALKIIMRNMPEKMLQQMISGNQWKLPAGRIYRHFFRNGC